MSELRTGLGQENDPDVLMRALAARVQPRDPNVGSLPSAQIVPFPGAPTMRAQPGPNNLRDQTVAWWVQNAGVPPHVAQGIADNIQRESSFQPDLVSPDTGGPSAGLYQAHLDRMTNLQQNPNWQDPNVQHAWALKQVTGGDQIATQHWNEIKNARTREEANQLWKQYFERPAGSSGSQQEAAQTSGHAELQRIGGQSQQLIDQLLKEGGRSKETWERLSKAQEKMQEYQERALKLAENPPQATPRDSIEKLGGLATIVGILGGLLTHQPLTASLNAAASAMDAYNGNDQETYKRSLDQWKYHTDVLQKMASFEHEQYRDILADEKMESSERMNRLHTVASLLGNDRMATVAQMGAERDARNHADSMAQSRERLELQKKEFELRFEQTQEQRDKQGWQVLTDPTAKDEGGNPIQYRYNPGTGEATTLDKKPYTPGGAQKMAGGGTGGQAGGAPLSDAAAERYAKIFQSSGYLPPGIARSSKAIAQIMNKTGDTGSPGEFLAHVATTGADTKSLAYMTRLADAATSYENTAIRNFDQALKYSEQGIATDWGPWVNRWVADGRTQFGDEKVPPYVVALLTAANEYAKVMTGSTGAAAATEGSRREAAEFFSPYLAQGQIQEVITVAKQEMENRREELYASVDDIKNRLRSAGSGGPTSSGHAPGGKAPVESPPPVGTIKMYQGKPYSFKGGDQFDQSNWEVVK